MNRKLKMCELRLEGDSIRNVARKTGVSPQTVSVFLKGFPTNPRHLGYPYLPMSAMLKVCGDFLHGMPVRAIASKRGFHEKQIWAILWYISARRPAVIKKTIYPSLTAWMQKNLFTVGRMADELDVSSSTFGNILAGRTHMPYELALQIKNMTGLSLSELFQPEVATGTHTQSRVDPVLPPEKRKKLQEVTKSQ